MRIKIYLYGQLRRHAHLLMDAHGNSGWLDLPVDTTVRDITDYLGLDMTEILLMDINGQRVDLNAGIREGDTVAFFPMADGG